MVERRGSSNWCCRVQGLAVRLRCVVTLPQKTGVELTANQKTSPRKVIAPGVKMNGKATVNTETVPLQ